MRPCCQQHRIASLAASVPLHRLHLTDTASVKNLRLFILALGLLTAWVIPWPASAATLYSNFASPAAYTGATFRDAYRANVLPMGDSAVQITEVVIDIQTHYGVTQPLNVRVCGSSANGFRPAADCAPFVSSQITDGLVSFSGSYTAAAYAQVWVIMSVDAADAGNPSNFYSMGLISSDPKYGTGTDNGGGTWFSPPTFSYRMQLNGSVILTPTITQLTPADSSTLEGNSVVIQGTNLNGATAVSFGGTPATSFSVNSKTQITAVTPAHAAGSVGVQVTTPEGSVTASGFTFIVPKPMPGTVSPSSGSTEGADSVLISGTYLTGATAVTFGGTPATSFTVDSDAQITAITPAHSAGNAVVQVTTPGGTNTMGSYQYVTPPPTVSGMAPTMASTLGGTVVTLTGAHLSGTTAVAFDGTPASQFTVVSGTQVTATAPAHAAGSATVLLTTPSGSAAAGTVLYVAPPVAGTCGSANAQSFVAAPSANLCQPGQATAVTSTDGQFRWTCAGENGGASSGQCKADWAQAGAGKASLLLPAPASNNGWTLGTASFHSAANLPSGATAPQGLVSFQLHAGTANSTATVVVQYTQALPANAVYMKYGKSPSGYSCAGADCAQDHWYTLPADKAVFSADRKSVTLTLQDGGLSDTDAVAGQITDPGGPVVLAAAPVNTNAIPTLSEYALMLLASAMGTLGLGMLRRRQMAQ